MQAQTTAAARERYLTLIEATLRHALSERLNRLQPDGLTMELALPAIERQMGLLGDDDGRFTGPATRFANTSGFDILTDGAGNARRLYWPLLVRPWAPFVARGPRVDEFSRAFNIRTEAFVAGRISMSVAEGGIIAARLLGAVTLLAIDSSSLEVVEAAFARAVQSQSDDGRFLRSSSADQLEPAWYHELAVLHAVDLYARVAANVGARAAAARSARYHAEQVQPDHASSHPFGLAALLDDAEGIHLADMMLHAAGVQQPATMDAVSLVLLFDALDCGRRGQPA